mmetsp:Transcript_27503/g.57569  ORF Transcript_27503/g.57569 Transcript_27503/m.57569 type:complete len:82 (+) Transcript_27503:2-247(+)
MTLSSDVIPLLHDQNFFIKKVGISFSNNTSTETSSNTTNIIFIVRGDRFSQMIWLNDFVIIKEGKKIFSCPTVGQEKQQAN